MNVFVARRTESAAGINECGCEEGRKEEYACRGKKNDNVETTNTEIIVTGLHSCIPLRISLYLCVYVLWRTFKGGEKEETFSLTLFPLFTDEFCVFSSFIQDFFSFSSSLSSNKKNLSTLY